MQITIRSFMDNLTINMDDRVLQLSEGEAKELTKQLVAHFARQAKAETYAISPPCDV